MKQADDTATKGWCWWFNEFQEGTHTNNKDGNIEPPLLLPFLHFTSSAGRGGKIF